MSLKSTLKLQRKMKPHKFVSQTNCLTFHCKAINSERQKIAARRISPIAHFGTFSSPVNNVLNPSNICTNYDLRSPILSHPSQEPRLVFDQSLSECHSEQTCLRFQEDCRARNTSGTKFEHSIFQIGIHYL